MAAIAEYLALAWFEHAIAQQLLFLREHRKYSARVHEQYTARGVELGATRGRCQHTRQGIECLATVCGVEDDPALSGHASQEA